MSLFLLNIYIFAKLHVLNNIIAKYMLNVNTFFVFPNIFRFIYVLYIEFTSIKFMILITLNILYFEIGSIVLYSKKLIPRMAINAI